MDNKRLIIICSAIILVAIITCGAVIAYSASEKTNVSTDLSEINKGDNLTITLSDSNGQPLANKIVHVTINGVTYDLTTDNTGKTQLPINLEANSYVINIKFDGESFKYQSCEVIEPLVVLEPGSTTSQTSHSSESTISDSQTTSDQASETPTSEDSASNTNANHKTVRTTSVHKKIPTLDTNLFKKKPAINIKSGSSTHNIKITTK